MYRLLLNPRMQRTKAPAMSLFRLILVLFGLLLASPYTWAQCSQGNIATNAPLVHNELRICTNDGNSDVIGFRFDYFLPGPSALVITDQNFKILATTPNHHFDFATLSPDNYYVFGLSYAGTFNPSIGDNIYGADFASVCARRSSNRIKVEVSAPEAGTISTKQGETNIDVCVGNSFPDYIGFELTGDGGADHRVYLEADAQGNIERISYRGYQNFQFHAPGTSYIYGLTYNGQLQAQVGDNIADNDLASGCYDLTANALVVQRIVIDGGSLEVAGQTHITIDSSTSQSITITRNATSNASTIYVIIELPSSKIHQFSTSETIDLSCLVPGKYLVYAYSYTGDVLAQVGDLLWQGGGRFASSCFINSGNAITVVKENPANCPQACSVDAGTLTPDQLNPELSNGTVILSASFADTASLPSDYELVYLLTQGPERIISAISADAPSFTVTSAGDFGIYAFAAELSDATSPNYYNLQGIDFGATPLDTLILGFGFGLRCGAVSDPGASFFVTNPNPVVCTAFAGGLLPQNPSAELENGSVVLDADPDGSASVPTNFEVRYLLTTGFDFIIEAIAATPEIAVSEAGSYIMHTLIGEFSDATSPDYIDLNLIELGTTSAFDFIAPAFNAGKCVDLDFFGAQFSVTDPGAGCTAFAGTASPAADTLELPASGTLSLSATPNGDAVIPAGFERTYILTQGANRTIVAIGARPRFTISDSGVFTIHSWVGEFNDPTAVDYIDINAIQLNQTPLADLLLLIDASGICSDIDEPGAVTVVNASSQTLQFRLITARVAPGVVAVEGISTSPATSLTLLLTTATGQLVQRVQAPAGQTNWQHILDRSLLPTGLYFLSCTDGKEVITQRVLLP